MPMRTRQRFEIRWESRFGAWPRDFALLLFSRAPKSSRTDWDFRWRRKGVWLRPVGGFFSSVFLHVFAFLLAVQFAFLPVRESPRQPESQDPGPIYIDMQALKILRDLPRIKPAGPGGRPGPAHQPDHAPAPGAVIFHPQYTIVLNPMKPDNVRQTIVQKSAAPDIVIPTDQKLPDIILVKQPDIAKPQVDLTFHRPNAAQASQNQPAAAAPSMPANAPQLPIRIAATVPQPQLPVSFLNSSMAPTAHSLSASEDQQASAAPAISSGGPQLSIRIAGTGQQPQLPGSYLNSNMTPSARSLNSPSTGPSGNGDTDMVVISVDPGTYSKLASLAQGNRYATLAIAPSPVGPGSPGGVPGAPAGGSSGNTSSSATPGAGGDASVAVGRGSSGGGGGGDSRGNAILSVSGGAGSAGGVDAHGILHGTIAATTVFPVISATKFHRPPLVVATGPMGGGGLDAYGALACGKVYTIFLPMPGKSWVLQYCAHQAGAATTSQANDSSVRLEQGLVPPDASQQFDFRRTAIPDKDADKLIVLRASINKDGSVSDVQVFQGLQPDMDAQAVIAFSSWKFRPAIRANNPIAVDVLVGIPARVPEKTSNLGVGGLGTQN